VTIKLIRDEGGDQSCRESNASRADERDGRSADHCPADMSSTATWECRCADVELCDDIAPHCLNVLIDGVARRCGFSQGLINVHGCSLSGLVPLCGWDRGL